MEFPSESNDNKPRKQHVRLSTEAKPRKKLGSILNIEKHEMRSYDDDIQQAVKNVEKSNQWHHKKQQVETKTHENVEVVKYMSYLPNYLQRGDNPKEKKPLSVGVLDWHLLQNWQHYHKDSTLSSFVTSEVDSLSHNLQTIGHDSPHSNSNAPPTRSSPWTKSKDSETFNAPQQLTSSTITDREFFKAVPDPSHIPGNTQSDSSFQANRYRPSSEFTSEYTYEGGNTKELQVVQSCSKEIRPNHCPSDKDQTKFPSSSSISIPMTKNNSQSELRNIADNESLQVEVGASETKKLRNPSPTRRLSFSIGRFGKSSTSNPVSDNICESNGTSASSCSTNSTCDKFGRARTSPLRRLRDPLLKSKGVDAKSSQRNPPIARTLKQSYEQRESPSSHSVKVKLDLKGCRTDHITESHKNVPSTKQALLQIAVKNGHPLFTFTVDNCNDILAATVKEVNCEKTDNRWIYTFFSFSEMKKKNAHWINQGSKERNHGYKSDMVAQMKVSDIRYSNSNRQREFVLSSLPCEELAAIVVKFPDDEGNELANNNEHAVTVILPGGHHAAPSKGEPSTLIKRWKSGGSCDCGGWDLGCQIRVLANTNQSKSRSFNLTESHFKLFSQEEVGERKPMLILSPFEDGIFSVEFGSWLQLIQAFSCAIAVVNIKTSPNMSQGSNMLSQNSVSAKDVLYPPPVSPVGRV